MPPPTATAGHAQEEAMDLSVVLQLVKKGIVLRFRRSLLKMPMNWGFLT